VVCVASDVRSVWVYVVVIYQYVDDDATRMR
jgi:hypothetical protein